jgi:hypothetical protein
MFATTAFSAALVALAAMFGVAFSTTVSLASLFWKSPKHLKQCKWKKSLLNDCSYSSKTSVLFATTTMLALLTLVLLVLVLIVSMLSHYILC